MAESVFWNARRRQLQLPEDFGVDEQDPEKEIYTEKYFKRKAITSLTKARSGLIKAGMANDNDTNHLYTAIGEMIDNFNIE